MPLFLGKTAYFQSDSADPFFEWNYVLTAFAGVAIFATN
jgi:hypothetical protein